MNSFSAFQDVLPRTSRATTTTLQDGIRLLSFSDRDLSKTGPNQHPSAYKMLKESDKRKEQIVQN